MSFKPLYKLQRAIPSGSDKILIVDKQGRAYLQKSAENTLDIPDAAAFPELLSVELSKSIQFTSVISSKVTLPSAFESK